MRKVEGRSTFLATRNVTIAIAKWSVTREFFLATCNAKFVALQVARKVAPCNTAFRVKADCVTIQMRAILILCFINMGWSFFLPHFVSYFSKVSSDSYSTNHEKKLGSF